MTEDKVMENVHFDKDGNLRVAVSTWIYLLHAVGIQGEDEQLNALCDQVTKAENESDGDAAGMALVEHVSTLLGDAGDGGGKVLGALTGVFGEAVSGDMGTGSRTERLKRIRNYQFSKQLPWLSRIWERRADGSVQPSWLLVERVTDQVSVRDPNPWNDVDEDRQINVGDFQVLWELDDCTSIYLQ